MTARSVASASVLGFDQPADGGERILGIHAMTFGNVGGGGNADGGGFSAEDRRGAEFGERLEQFGRHFASESAKQ